MESVHGCMLSIGVVVAMLRGVSWKRKTFGSKTYGDNE